VASDDEGADRLVASARRSSNGAAPRAKLSLLATKRIYFAHQSVGANNLEGVADLARSAGVPVRIVQSPRAADVPSAAFGHLPTTAAISTSAVVISRRASSSAYSPRQRGDYKKSTVLRLPCACRAS